MHRLVLFWIVLKNTRIVILSDVFAFSKLQGEKKQKNNVSKLASYSQSLPGLLDLRCQNYCMKVLKVRKKHAIVCAYKMNINNIKFPGGRPESPRCLLLLVSSPLLFVYLAAQLRGGAYTRRGRPKRGAFWETESTGGQRWHTITQASYSFFSQRRPSSRWFIKATIMTEF